MSAAVFDSADAAAVQRLYRHVGRAAISKTTRIVGRVQVAQEIVQDVFVRLWEAPKTFPSEKAAYCWVYKCCHNAGIDYLRSARYRTDLDDTSAGAEPLLVVESKMEKVLIDRESLAAILGRLSAAEGRIFVYFALDGMTHEEIGVQMGLAKKTITRTLKRIEAQLKVGGTAHG